LTGAIACALCSGACAEDEAKGKLAGPAGPAGRTVVYEVAGGPGEKPFDETPPKDRYPDDGGVDDAGTLPPNETYDDSTGMQNRVPSDSYGEIDK
jgi:hypothetical protein